MKQQATYHKIDFLKAYSPHVVCKDKVKESNHHIIIHGNNIKHFCLRDGL
jgi:hypothetical protein